MKNSSKPQIPTQKSNRTNKKSGNNNLIRYQLNRRYNVSSIDRLLKRLSYDEMIEASSMFDAIINGASTVNSSSISQKVKRLVGLTQHRSPNTLRNVYQTLNKTIVATNHQRHRTDPSSAELYKQLMGTKQTSKIDLDHSLIISVRQKNK